MEPGAYYTFDDQSGVRRKPILLWVLVGIVALLSVLFIWLLFTHDDNNAKKATTDKAEKPLTVSLEGISEGKELSGTVAIGVKVDNISRVAYVKYYVDDVFVGVTYSLPFSYSLDTTELKAGKHIVTAKAYDKKGKAYKTQAVTITVKQLEESTPDPAPATGGSTAPVSGGTGSGASGGSSSNPGTPADTTAPSVPGNVLLSADDGYTTHIAWNASTDNTAVSGYRIYRDNTLLGTVLGASTTTYLDQTVVPGNTYEYSVQSYDAAANESVVSNEPSITLEQTSIWIDADSPQSFASDAGSLELGVKFRPLVSGKVTGIRFWKDVANVGTHTGNLWSSAGTPLGSATFVSETASGWQEVTFATPVDVVANTTYIASYTSSAGFFSFTANYFATAGITSQYLSALASGVDGNNGIFGVGGSFPTGSFNNNNYWVDALFTPNPSAGGPSTYQTLDTSTVHPGFPGSNNTGLPVGKRLPVRDREIFIYADGSIMENIESNAEVHVRADNVLIRKSKINSILYMDIDQVPYNNYTFTVEDSEVDAKTASRPAISLGNYTARRVNVHGGQTSMLCSANCIVEDSWMHGQYMPPDEDWHLGAFLSNGGANMLIRNNTISCDVPNNVEGGGCSGDLNLYGDFAPIEDITIDGNLFTANIDAGYCLSAGYGIGKPFSGDANNVDILNNIFQRGTNGLCAAFGPATNYEIGGVPAPGNSWINNRWDDGTVLPEPL